MSDLTPEQREAIVATLTTHHHVKHDGSTVRCDYCANYYGDMADRLAPVVAQMLADERERIVSLILAASGADVTNEQGERLVFRNPLRLGEALDRIARGDAA